MKHETIVPDTSVVIEGILSKKIAANEIQVDRILIHEAVLCELEHQANQNKETGILGLDELQRLQQIAKEHNIKIEFAGNRPHPNEIKFAKLGEIDYLIRDLAFTEGATLLTADKTQADAAKAKNIKVELFEKDSKERKLLLEEFFDKETMSVHLKENMQASAKKGKPGSWEFIEISKNKLPQKQIREISKDIIEQAQMRKDGFIEIERRGSTIVQLGLYRIVITKPPFSEAWEITAARPVKQLTLADYELPEKLKKRIADQAEGILISGSPGEGKSTFAQALAEHFADQKKVVKTVEAPRDLILKESITQYAASHGSPEEIHDVLLLTRPDYTIFDEIRNTKDFELFSDLRLSGVGMVGVVHATNPIDAIQRFIGRIELGVIPQVIDTVVFIKGGKIHKMYNVEMTVKVPSGMTESDLARPIVTVTDFQTNKLEFEIYSYGEQTVVIPVKAQSTSPLKSLAAEKITEAFSGLSDIKVEVVSDHKCILYALEKDVARIIGKQGKNIDRLEKKLGMNIDVQPITKSQKTEDVPFDIKVIQNNVLFRLNKKFITENLDIYVNDDYVITAHVSKKAEIRLKKNSPAGKIISKALKFGDEIRILLN